ncbi:MAG: LysR family transcriptional regulator substrate-binding protein, partial [Cyanobacteria bacterium P01_C01_bin.69]
RTFSEGICGREIDGREGANRIALVVTRCPIAVRPVYEHVNRLGYWLNVVSEIETDSATVNLVEQGLGGTILPRLAAEPIPDSLQVYSLPVPLERQIAVAILTDALQPPAVYALLEVLQQSG